MDVPVPWTSATWIFQWVHERSSLNFRCRFSDVIPLHNHSQFLSFWCSSSADRCDTNWILYFAFILLTASSSPIFSPIVYFSITHAPKPSVPHFHLFPSSCCSFFPSAVPCSVSVTVFTLFLSFFPPTFSSFFFASSECTFFFQPCRGRKECRLNCRMANNCTTLIAILHSVFRNNQIR